MSLDPTPSRVARRGRDPAAGVYYKLGFFSVALFVAPISAYYLAKDRWLGGDAVYAGGIAALVANLVLAGYIIAACLEDDGMGGSGQPAKPEASSARPSVEQKKSK